MPFTMPRCGLRAMGSIMAVCVFETTQRSKLNSSFVRALCNNMQLLKPTRCFAHKSSKTSSAQTIHLIRNIGIMAHIDAGKTTTTERMLYYSGMTRSIGSIDDGTTQMDFLEEERNRGITIASAVTTFPWRGHRINLIDTPGHVDFTVEVECALRVLDGAVAVFDAVAGVQAQTLKVWRQAAKNSIPVVAFVNKMDRDGASLSRTVRSIEEKLDIDPIVLHAPVREGHEESFRGMIDFVNLTEYSWKLDRTDDGSEFTVKSLEEMDKENSDIALNGREVLAEQLADIDDDFAEYVLDDDYDPVALDARHFKKAIRKATLNRTGIPVLCGSARRNKGVQQLLDAVVDFLPSPQQRPPVLLTKHTASIASRKQSRKSETLPETIELPPLESTSTCALVFKIVFDAHRGVLAFARLYSGSLKAQGTIYNSTKGIRERITRLLMVNADSHNEVPSVLAGNIVALVGLKQTTTGDTIVATGDDKTSCYRMNAIHFPEPVFTCSIEAESSQKADDLDIALFRLQQEDPSLHVARNEETGQTLLSGMGELHLEIAISRLESHYNVKCLSGPMKVAYRERPTRTARLEVTEDTTSCTVDLCALPTPTDEAGGDVLNAVRQGILAVCSRGVQHGYPIMSAKISVLSLNHDADLGIVAFCAAEATRKAMREAHVDLMHPIMQVEITVEADDIGDVLHDLSGARQGTVHGYDGALRGLTSGTGSFSMHYDSHGVMNQAGTMSAS